MKAKINYVVFLLLWLVSCTYRNNNSNLQNTELRENEPADKDLRIGDFHESKSYFKDEIYHLETKCNNSVARKLTSEDKNFSLNCLSLNKGYYGLIYGSNWEKAIHYAFLVSEDNKTFRIVTEYYNAEVDTVYIGNCNPKIGEFNNLKIKFENDNVLKFYLNEVLLVTITDVILYGAGRGFKVSGNNKLKVKLD